MTKLTLIIYFMMLLISIPCWAVNAEIVKKYPNILANDDHGILHDGDIWVYHHGNNSNKNGNDNTKNSSDDFFSIEKPYNYYWHCFKRKNMLISLDDYQDSDNSRTGTDDISFISISGKLETKELPDRFSKRYKTNSTNGDKVELSIDYNPRAVMSLTANKEIMREWRRLMRNQEYVCLLGFVSGKPEVAPIYGGGFSVKYKAEFVTITTKKGSLGWFDDDTSFQYAKDYKKWLKNKS